MEVEVEVMHVTEKAMLLKIAGDEHWVPRSQIEEPEVEEKGDVGTVLLSKWIAGKLGLVE
jgi:hypothetical protein